MKNPEQKFLRRWIKALRSGKYKQGKWSLHPRKEEYCCLGVACDLLKGEIPAANIALATHATHLPAEVEALLQSEGVAAKGGNIRVKSDHESQRLVSNLNDGGKTFTEIAGILEENFLVKKS